MRFIRYKIIKHDNANNDYLIIGIKIMELAEKAYDLFQHMTTAEKKRDSKTGIIEPSYYRGKCLFFLSKLFNLIAELPSGKVWLGDEDSNLG